MSNDEAPDQKTVGVIGLGLVGSAISTRLMRQGYRCIGCDIDRGACERFTAAGGHAVSSAREVAEQAPRIVAALFNTDDLAQVIEGPDGLLAARSGSLSAVIDCSTADPDRLAGLARQLMTHGIALIEAPLSGSSSQIAAGEASMLLGGLPTDIASHEDLLAALSPIRLRVGDTGMGARAKLATTLVLGLNRAAFAEGLVFAEHLGIAPALFLQLVLGSPARSEAATVKGPLMVGESFAPQSRIRQHLKDVELMINHAKARNQRLPLSEAHAALLRAAIDAGDGELDNAAIVRQMRRLTLPSR